MKILFLSDINNVHTKKWVKGILKAGHELMLFGLAGPQDDFYQKFNNLKIVSAEFTEQYGGSSFSKVRYLKTIRKLKSAYKSFSPDIVHAHYATSYGMLGSFLKHHPFLISVWGSDVYDFPKKSIFHRALLKRNLSKADYIFSTSHDMAGVTQNYTTKEIQVIPFGVDTNSFKPIDRLSKGNKITIGVVKTLEPKYGISYLIKAFSKVRQKHPERAMELLIVGGGSLIETLQKQVQKLGIGSSVQFTGKVAHSEIPNYFNQMDIVVIPSILDGESFGVAAVEASACAKPVIASNTGGLKEVIQDGENGLLSEPQNADDIARKIDFLIENPDERRKMGNRGRENVIKKYDWSKCLEIQLDAYESILKNR